MFLGPLAACDCFLMGEKARPLEKLLANATQDSISVIAHGERHRQLFLAMRDFISNPRLTLFAVAGSAEGPGGAKSHALILP